MSVRGNLRVGLGAGRRRRGTSETVQLHRTGDERHDRVGHGSMAAAHQRPII